MNINEIINLPDNLETINVLLEYLKKANDEETYIINVRLLEIYYLIDRNRFLILYNNIDKINPLNDEYFQRFLNIKAKYLIEEEKYDEAYQAVYLITDNHKLLGDLYFYINNFIDAKREYLLSDEKSSNLAFIYFEEQNIDKALEIANKENNELKDFFEVLKKYSEGGLLNFPNTITNKELLIRIAILKMKTLNPLNAYVEGKKCLIYIDDVYVGLRYKFYKTFYNLIKNKDEQEQINLEIKHLEAIINKPLVYKGEDSYTLKKLDKLYDVFTDFEKLLKASNDINLDLDLREYFRLSMIELNKLVPFSQAIYLYDTNEYAYIIDYKKNLAYDKVKPLDSLYKTPFDMLLINGDEHIINSLDDLYMMKDIVTGKSLNEQNIKVVYSIPILNNEDVTGGISFYSNTLNTFSDYSIEILKLYINHFISCINQKQKLSKSISTYQIYKELFDKSDFSIKYIYNNEIFLNKSASKLDEEISFLQFEETSLVYQEGLKQIYNGEIKSFNFEFQVHDKYFLEHLKGINIENKKLIISSIRDVTEEKKQLNYQTALAENSYICRLPNRRVLERDLIDYVDDKFTIFALDINHFKMFNDVYGYEAGDIAIKTLARSIKKFDEALVAYHLDSDKFIILYNYVNDQRTIKKLALRLVKFLEEEMYDQNYRFRFSFTISSLRYPVHTNDKKPRKLIKMAVSALYNAKQSYLYQSKYLDYDKTNYKNDIFEQILLTQVSEAIDNKNLIIKYQQVVNMKNLKVLHYNALVNVSTFNVEPSYIMKIARKRNLITTIDRYLIRRTLSDINQMISTIHRYINIAFAVDIKTFMQDDFYMYLREQLNEFAINPQIVSLEVIGDYEDFNAVNEKIQLLRNLGLKIIINDISSVVKVQATYVKIKEAHHYLNKEHSLVVLKNLEELVKVMDMSIIMSGVNTIDEANLIKGLGIRYVEGKCYNRKSTIEELIEKLGANNGRTNDKI